MFILVVYVLQLDQAAVRIIPVFENFLRNIFLIGYL